jgi:hypothetical protein
VTNERKAQIVTLAVLAVIGGVVVGRTAKWQLPAVSTPQVMQPKTAATPQDTIYAMLDAARDGDPAKYLACYSGQMLTSLEQSVNETGKEGFTKYLKDSNAPIKGVALNEPQVLTDREVKVRVEFVYQERNEVQFMYLEKSGSAWKIARVDATERVKTLIPYGTPVQ